MARFKDVEAVPHFPDIEERILSYWKEQNIFEKSVQSKPQNKTWTFLDGPPFVTGMPHYGSLLSSLPKDLFGRFWTMKGYRVRRVWGWDGHGLPIENKVENELHVERKRDIEKKIGVKKFIEECKKYVDQVSAEWEWYVDHIGRWVDFRHAYKTWSTDYMESVMWVFKQLYDKGRIYKGLRVTLYCPHCATPISNFEVAMDAENYAEEKDFATTYKYQLQDEKNTFLLAWSTTPWNKIVTPALAVNPKLGYVKVRQNNECYILAKSTVAQLGNATDYEIVEEMKGKELIGKKFIPHFDYYKIEKGKKVFEVIGGDFVTSDEGTGIVTIAAYGEEDLKIMQEQNIHIEMHLDEEGMVKKNVPLFGGMFYLKANKAVNENLKKRGLVYKDEILPHNVPHCWRCHTRLYYAPINAWYVNIQDLKEKLIETNEKVNWFPSHFKYGRFLKSVEHAPDWNISRNRYWGSPVPVWECECGEHFVPSSIKELEERSGKKIVELHKPEIDEIVVPCNKCKKQMKRTPEVLDSWIEAGSASFAERHFPFNSTEKLEDFFPPDFIAEYTGQIRAWFYVLHVIGTALYDSPAFKNVLVEGVILGTDGRKMSKNFKNYPDPKEMLRKYGGDALRLYLLGSPVMKGEDILISEQAYKNQVRGLLLILWNVYKYFVTYANSSGYQAKNNSTPQSHNILDIWIISLLNQLIKKVTDNLENYDTVPAINNIYEFVQDLSTWYIRRSRDRATSEEFLSTLHSVLVKISILLAPIAPFISEEIYRNLADKESVHLEDWPSTTKAAINTDLLKQMETVRSIVEMGHSKRREKKVPVKQPLANVIVTNVKTQVTLNKELDAIILADLNVKKVEHNKADAQQVDFDWNITEELKLEGEARQIIRKIQEERKKLGTALDEKVIVELPDWPAIWEEEIKRKAMISQLKKADQFKVLRLNA